MLLNAYTIMHEMREQALIGLEARTAFVAYYLYDVRNNMQNVHTQGVHTQRISQTLPKGIVGRSRAGRSRLGQIGSTNQGGSEWVGAGRGGSGQVRAGRGGAGRVGAGQGGTRASRGRVAGGSQ